MSLLKKDFTFAGTRIEVICVLSDAIIWFLASTFALLLGYNSSNNHLSSKVSSENRREYSTFKIPYTGTKINGRSMFINERGLYEWALASNMPQAKLFQKWVYEDVLPELRQSGIYSLENASEEQRQQVGFIRSITGENVDDGHVQEVAMDLTSQTDIGSNNVLQYLFQQQQAMFEMMVHKHRELSEVHVLVIDQSRAILEMIPRITATPALEDRNTYNTNAYPSNKLMAVYSVPSRDPFKYGYKMIRTTFGNIRKAAPKNGIHIVTIQTPDATETLKRFKYSIRPKYVHYSEINCNLDASEIITIASRLGTRI